MADGPDQPNGLLGLGITYIVTDPAFNDTEFNVMSAVISNYYEL